MLKKRGEYAKAKKVLKDNKIKFQTPYPAKMKIFYSDGTQLFQDATEATWDMVSLGFPVPVVRYSKDPNQEEIRLLSTWQVAGRRHDQSGDKEYVEANDERPKKSHRSQYKDKLQGFQRRPPPAND